MICLTGLTIFSPLGPGGVAGYLVGIGMCVGSWVVGRWMRSRSLLARELERKVAQLSAERQDRQRLTIAHEQTRIARALHETVAERVSTMVVEAAAAQLMLQHSPELAKAEMEAIEVSGRAS